MSKISYKIPCRRIHRKIVNLVQVHFHNPFRNAFLYYTYFKKNLSTNLFPYASDAVKLEVTTTFKKQPPVNINQYFEVLNCNASQPFGLQVPAGKRQFFKLLSLSNFLGYCVLQYTLQVPENTKHQIDEDFAFTIIQIIFLLPKFNIFSHIQVEISKLRIFKNISSP